MACVSILYLCNETFPSPKIYVKYLAYSGYRNKTDKMNKNQFEPCYKGHQIEFVVFLQPFETIKIHLRPLIWIILDQFGPNWTHLDSLGHSQTYSDTFGPFWIHLDPIGHNWTLLDQFGVIWTNM